MDGSEYDRSEYSFRHSGDHAGYSFAGVNFYIPADWNIVDQTGCTFGGVKEQQATAPTVGPTIIFEGKITFGGVEIYRV